MSIESKISSETTITPNEALHIGNSLFRALKDKGLTGESARQYLRKENADFCVAFPIVAEFMTDGEYHPDAFKRYLEYYVIELQTRGAGNMAEVSVTWPAFLMRKKNPQMNLKQFEKVKERFRSEYRKSKESLAESLEEFKKKSESERESRRLMIIEQLRAKNAATAAALKTVMSQVTPKAIPDVTPEVHRRSDRSSI